MRVTDYLRLELQRINDVVGRQVNYLRLNVKGDLLSKLLEEGLVIGSGDSHAAALYTQLLSNHRFNLADPYELRLLPPPGEGVLIAISVKGRTREVVNASKTLKSRGWKVVAITSDTSSPLARVADAVVKVTYGGGELPVGICNFASVITALTWMFKGVKGIPSKLRFMGYDGPPLKEFREVVAVGEGLGAVSAYFTCLKLHEVICMPCRHYSIEQFMHADIYSLSSESLTLIFPGISKGKSLVLSRVLSEAGLPHHLIQVNAESELSVVLSGIYTAVTALINCAEDLGVEKPCFMTRNVLLKLSTPAIYGEKNE